MASAIDTSNGIFTAMIEKPDLKRSSKFNWNYQKHFDEQDVRRLIIEYPKLHPAVAKVLASKRLISADSIQKYFSSDLEEQVAGLEMKDLEKSAERLITAISDNEKIRLYGDYDVDGTASVAMMSRFLESIGANFDFYIPDRYTEGYGISEKGVDLAIEDRIGLLISLDCGIRAVAKVDRLRTNQIDVIICDHHEPGSVVPPAFSIINHKQQDCENETKILCGCGVALMLLFKVVELMDLNMDIDPYLELAAIATCADIVPIKAENRAIVARGLEVISRKPSPGIQALLRNGGFKKGPVRVSDVVFKIAPRINAAGRMDHASLGVSLLTSNDVNEAEEIADHIEKLNVARKERDAIITAEAREMLFQDDPELERSSTILAKENWHKGLVGIVASRIMEIAYRPTIILTEVDGLLTGSARSTSSFDLHKALTACSEHLTKFGGHAAAAGLTLDAKNYESFKNSFEAYAQGVGGKGFKTPELEITLDVDFDHWHGEDYQNFYSQLNRLRPYGPDNRQPVFSTANCIASNVKVVGSDHLRFFVSQAEGKKRDLPVIAFGFANHYEVLAAGQEFELAYTIEENLWNGKRSLQLVAKDFKIS
ncbi:MAG: single-stranded-DNA-specific exonuclease RecJ [Bacteroidota bacterium]